MVSVQLWNVVGSTCTTSVRGQQVHSRRERNLNDGGRRLQHFTTRTIREKRRAQGRGKSRALQSMGKPLSFSVRQERGYAQYTNPYHPYREAEDSRAQQGSGKKEERKRAKRGSGLGFPHNSTAQHSLTRTKKKEVTTTQYTTFQDCKERGGGTRFPTARASRAITWCPQVSIPNISFCKA